MTFIHIYLKLKKILQKSQLYPFKFPGVFTPKPPAKNSIPKKSLHGSLMPLINTYPENSRKQLANFGL